MKRYDPTTISAAEAIVRLYEGGNNDPTFKEIAADTLGRHVDQLTGDLVAPVSNRCDKLRTFLEEKVNILSMPICEKYYESGLRDRAPRSAAEVEAALPAAYRKSVGIRIVRPNADDPFYAAYLAWKGGRGASQVRNASEQASKAFEIGSMTGEVRKALFEAIDDRLATRLTRRLNGGSTAQID